MINKVTVELPCQIGQTVYYINKYKKKVDTDEVKYLRENYPEIKIRVNTNGHANAIYKKNIHKIF